MWWLKDFKAANYHFVIKLIITKASKKQVGILCDNFIKLKISLFRKCLSLWLQKIKENANE